MPNDVAASSTPGARRPASTLSRRRVLGLGAALGGASALSLAGCSTAPSSDAVTSQLIHGATGGGLKDTVDPHFPVTFPDIARCTQLYEPLMRFNAAYEVEPGLAESAEMNADGTEWTFRLRQGVTFHNGRPVTGEDVKFSFERMLDPKNPAAYLSDVAPIADLSACKALDARTYKLVLKEPYTIMDRVVAAYSLGIIPTDFNLNKPVGTGPWKFEKFVPGQRSVFSRFDGYWDVQASYDELVILDFADDAAKVNALLAGQLQTVDSLPAYLAGSIERQGARTLVSETGGWVPFTMRVDTAPFNDVRVRQAMRMLVDRKQMIDQALNGFGRVANDVYSPFDPDYIGDQLPQHEYDPEHAKALLRQAGHSDLQVELVTSSGIGAGAVESANLIVQQAAKAGVKVRVNKVDGSIFYGDQYLTWPFAQDFWYTRLYIPQAVACAVKTAPYNETHFEHPRFTQLIDAARSTTDEARRRRYLQEAQEIEHNEGGLIIWGFKNQVDAVSQFVTGLKPYRELPMASFHFNHAKPVETR
ncbi:ABC transporter substrate-binding protein [Nigerium massiliense]|uniref:ABC transporter substrate-binding protein n=1 Tax=Nigerium massiliense TaxID=1522317 RepID=UPI001C44E0D9|nr:ABC transporter substrate-binding protein [Nigerium massiliense]